jgi:hypothetical protein
VPEEKARLIARESILSAFREGALDWAGVTERIRRAEQAYLAQPKLKFVLVSSASIHYDHHRRIPTSKIDGGTISFHWGIPARFVAPASLKRASDKLERLPFTYAAVTVAVQERCSAAAVERAFQSFDLLRAIWNFDYNFRAYSHRLSAAHQPFNDIVAGPIQTLHAADGTPVEDAYWHDPAYSERLTAKEITQNLERTKNTELRFRTAIRESPIGPTLRRLLLRYGRALDERSPGAAFLRLWAVLEEATGTQNARYDETIRRASFLWPDTDFQRVILNDIRYWRNSMVHEGTEPEQVFHAVEELRHYVERLILFLRQNARRFKDMQQFANFLDLPVDAAELLRRARVHSWAARLRTPR